MERLIGENNCTQQPFISIATSGFSYGKSATEWSVFYIFNGMVLLQHH